MSRNTMIHVLVWGSFFMISASAHIFASGNWVSGLSYSSVGWSARVGVFYINLLLLMPLLLERKRYVFYGLSVVATIATATFLIYFGEVLLIENGVIMPPGEMQEILDRLSPENKNKLHGARVLINGVTLFGVLFLSAIIRNVSVRRKQEQEKILLENKALEAQSKFLKAQINPHFLFNSLNNIYALSQLQSPKTPESIHRLSHILRYVLYESNSETVELHKEVTYIQSYIDLMLLKDENITGVTFDANLRNNSLRIMPMLLLPFVENSFKHSLIEDVEYGWIDIRMKCEGSTLQFTCSNSKPGIVHTKDSTGGVGLENVKKRLELNYAGNHKLSIRDSAGKYEVELEIQLGND